ncbi:hypothetical protein GALMADRAFT_253736 [Galerina marginata CBS 339.88]|uniref:Uncharacterized protein n=1 Tax=Galerina marginata (strain CBS 339.88) TaxID=685588 RepID=A0A067SKJ5_GALM3|nr:hypothetical protein GALMADRAFT_253736 [Galerina marginata CBS 339.88]
MLTSRNCMAHDSPLQLYQILVVFLLSNPPTSSTVVVRHFGYPIHVSHTRVSVDGRGVASDVSPILPCILSRFLRTSQWSFVGWMVGQASEC